MKLLVSADFVGEGIDFGHCIIASCSCESDCTASAIMVKKLVMWNFNLNKEYIDLNSTPADYDAGHLPVLSSENIRISTEEHNDARPTGGPTLIEISGELLFPSMPGETSGPSPKRRSCKRPQDLPDGWTVQERVRLSGKSAGKTYKFFIEPGTRKKFRSMPEVRRHLGMDDP